MSRNDLMYRRREDVVEWPPMFDLLVIGGGAAGIFAAIAAKAKRPSARVAVLEKSAVLLAKVRVSGGGRCNVTHACFDPKLLVKNYPRGEKELLGPFHRFQPKDTVEWFESRGVKLKAEEDGRMFPVTDSSETIIDCLLKEAEEVGVEIRLRQRIEEVRKGFEVIVKGEVLQTKRLLLATGSSAEGHAWAEKLGHKIEKPVPSLFTLNVPDSPLKELSGIAVEDAEASIQGTSLRQRGPLLITHFGFSGPAALKLSAWGARYFAEAGYKVELCVDWLPGRSGEELFEALRKLKERSPKKMLATENVFSLPKNLWRMFVGEKFLKDVSHKELKALAERLHRDVYRVDGKTTNKEEFVTCGGVCLKEVDFKTMQSKICPGLFFAGEVLDIDGVTGGFNFQNAWTTGMIGGSSAAALD